MVNQYTGQSAILPRINHSHDVKGLSLDELHMLAAEIRERIITVVDQNGGHLGSNLGSVELTLALHRVFDLPKDRLVWDVSHQTYPHKLITGRRDRFHTIRQYDGICGFCNKRESIFDTFDAGHAGTSISLAVGTAVGDRYLGERNKSIAVVGDSSIAAGMAFEALNHGGEVKPNLLVILNDNKMSIAKTVGALSGYLNRIRTKPLYHDFKKEVHDVLSKIPVVGKRMESAFEQLAERVKHSVVPGLLFQELGFNYYGPVDGHDLRELMKVLEDLRHIEAPALLHVCSEKGHGYEPASADPIKFHALKNFIPRNEPAELPTQPAEEQIKPPAVTYSKTFVECMLDIARKDRRIVGITAAMPGGTGLSGFKSEFPDRFFDVGIAEQHGGAFSSGLAYSGLRPVFAVYSTFCQRAYDQFVHDVCIQENSVIFCLDRAGLVEDGWTHHGVFDIAYMRCIPNVILMAPRDGDELRRMFRLAVDQSTHPIAMRYPRSNVPTHLPPAASTDLEIGRSELMLEGREVAIFAYGSMVEVCYDAATRLAEQGTEVTLVNARFAKPVDVDRLRDLSENHSILVTAEEHALAGGFGSAVVEACVDRDIRFSRTVRLGVPDQFITFGKRERLLADCGIDVDGVVAAVTGALEGAPATPGDSRRVGYSADAGRPVGGWKPGFSTN